MLWMFRSEAIRKSKSLFPLLSHLLKPKNYILREFQLFFFSISFDWGGNKKSYKADATIEVHHSTLFDRIWVHQPNADYINSLSLVAVNRFDANIQVQEDNEYSARTNHSYQFHWGYVCCLHPLEYSEAINSEPLLRFVWQSKYRARKSSKQKGVKNRILVQKIALLVIRAYTHQTVRLHIKQLHSALDNVITELVLPRINGDVDILAIRTESLSIAIHS